MKKIAETFKLNTLICPVQIIFWPEPWEDRRGGDRSPAQGGAPATSSASAAVEGGGGSGDGSCGYSTRVVSVGCTRGQPRPKRLQGSSGNKKKKGGSFEAGQEGPRCHAVTVRTMCFPSFRQNRSIFVGNLGLFGVYFYGLMANA